MDDIGSESGSTKPSFGTIFHFDIWLPATNLTLRYSVPIFGIRVDDDAAGFTIYYPANATGFATPTWNGYHAVPNSSAQVPALLLFIDTQKAVYLTSTNLVVGLNYQIQGSADLIHWGNQGSGFTAANSTWQSTNHWNASDANRFFFRLQVVQ